ncbi:MAG: non-heme chloroperoxidase [Frankiaceae bacterium]|nr:non-heme chloroperoxidase [Frankiaceae bacterium]
MTTPADPRPPADELPRAGSETGLVQLSRGPLFLRAWGDGSAPTVLLVHSLGWGASSMAVAPIAAALAWRTGRRVLAPDLPGFGQSPRAADVADYKPAALAAHLTEMLDALGVTSTSYAGISWGATIGCWLAAAEPARLNALVLVDGGHVDPADAPGFEAHATLRDRLRAARLNQPTWRSLDRALDKMAEAYDDWTPWLDDAWRAALEERDKRWRPIVGPDVYAAAVDGIATSPVSATRPAIAAAGLPVTLVVPPESVTTTARFTAAVPRTTVSDVPATRTELLGAGLSATIAAIEAALPQ